MDILKKIYQSVWNFMMDYAEYRARCIRQHGITGFY